MAKNFLYSVQLTISHISKGMVIRKYLNSGGGLQNRPYYWSNDGYARYAAVTHPFYWDPAKYELRAKTLLRHEVSSGVTQHEWITEDNIEGL